MIRIGVIGVGHMGQLHIKKICKLSVHFKLMGIYDKNLKLASDVAMQYNTRHFDSLNELMDMIDTAVVATTSKEHFKIVRKLLVAGINVLVEKPMVTSVDEAENLYEIIQNSGAVLQVGFIERFNPAINFLDSILEGKIIQKMIFIRESDSSRIKDIDVIMDLMIHDIDLSYKIFGSELQLTEADGFKVSASNMLEQAFAGFVASNGAKILLVSSRISNKKMRQIRVFTEQEYIEVDLLTNNIYVYDKKNGNMHYEIEKMGNLYEDALTAELMNFATNIKNRNSVFCDFDVGIHALRVIEKIKKNIA